MSRKHVILSSGFRSLVKLRERYFADVDGNTESTQRFINFEISRAASANDSYSEVVFIWDSGISEKISQVETGSYIHVVGVVATCLLTAERAYATYSRFK